MADNLRHGAEPAPLILTVPGLANSGPGHWQTLWEEQRGDCRRVELGQWHQPHRNSWVNQLNLAIRSATSAANPRPVILVAHSLGCLAVAWWALLEGAAAGTLVAGALLVAPPDVDTAPDDARLAGFSPAPAAPLPFPTIVVASRNDPYMPIRTARRLAQAWQAGFADAGPIGHINAESGIAEWPFGQFLLGRLLARGSFSEQRPCSAPASRSDSIAAGTRPASASVHAGEASRVAHARGVSPIGTIEPARLGTDPPPAIQR